ncbi:protocatechuate 3,4-dioxygenase [Thalassotalea sp. Y01]|uniref:dioxygenase family protein n=1 Tax=Thalassotalea sp. Y01 TaxID=2729613 RepID=UPI00145F6146|nr:protocatechuate 3,4-dioxygenase [Thalassotalea sp. Y01]NMP17314.1 hypothetical protein [Thalassotalea sp. Y01]
MSDPTKPGDKRTTLKLIASVASLSVLAKAKASPFEHSTPSQTMGPFFPVARPLDSDMDLTQVKGKDGVAKGQVIELSGQVINSEGKPVANAVIKVWQANVNGRYDHKGDINPAPLDPNFQGYGEQITDEQGRYRFKTIKPGAYPINPVNPDNVRPPHIHFDVAGKVDRLVTQMYFPDEPGNKDDIIFKRLGDGQKLVVASPAKNSPDMAKDSIHLNWNIVLPHG